MGMFDELNSVYPLPYPDANLLTYQTKSLNCQMDLYQIREDGTLWFQDYDIEDKSDPNATNPFDQLCGCMTRVNKRWQAVDFTGEVRFYSSFSRDWSDWIEWSAYFVGGLIRELHLVKREPAPTAEAVGLSVDDSTDSPRA